MCYPDYLLNNQLADEIIFYINSLDIIDIVSKKFNKKKLQFPFNNFCDENTHHIILQLRMTCSNFN